MGCDHQRYKALSRFRENSIYECRDCGLVFDRKYIEKFNPEDLYADYYGNEITKVGRFVFGIEDVIKLFRFFRAFKIFTICPKAKKILDVGSGRGWTLYFLKKIYGYERAAGTQISKNAYEFARNALGLEIYNKDLLKLDLGKASFDLVTIWQVLEHVLDPEGYIAKMGELLERDGRLVIEVPNFNSWTSGLTGKYWLGLDLDYHMFFFTRDSLTALLEKHNFKIKWFQTFSLEYSTFISAQSLVSFFTKSEHLFFSYMQTGDFRWSLLLHIPLFILLVPVCLLANILLHFSEKGEILFFVAQKR
jgi:SAM-dependent methyltransferase